MVRRDVKILAVIYLIALVVGGPPLVYLGYWMHTYERRQLAHRAHRADVEPKPLRNKQPPADL
jgi:hypothetical protein